MSKSSYEREIKEQLDKLLSVIVAAISHSHICKEEKIKEKNNE